MKNRVQREKSATRKKCNMKRMYHKDRENEKSKT